MSSSDSRVTMFTPAGRWPEFARVMKEIGNGIRDQYADSYKKKPVGFPLWVCLEGPDRTGKTTQKRLLAKALNAWQLDTGDWPHSELFESLLETGEVYQERVWYRFLRTAEQYWMQDLLYERGGYINKNPVVTGRWVYSSFAYEAGPDALDPWFIFDLTKNLMLPDITLVLFRDRPLPRKGEEDKFDLDESLQKAVVERFRVICDTWPNVYPIETRGTSEDTHKIIIDFLRGRGVDVETLEAGEINECLESQS